MLQQGDVRLINLDKLTYAGNSESLADVSSHPRYSFVQGDIVDSVLVKSLLQQYHPQMVVNFAAESHVDRSIEGPEAFIQTNIVGTFHLLEAVRSYWNEGRKNNEGEFRFLHISTDEVYGSSR